MKRLVYVEIDLETCSRSYGVAPCTASIPTTGNTQCYNSRKTCQDIENYNGTGGLTLRFAIDTGFLPASIDCIPNMINYSYAPSSVSLGENLGNRANLKVTLKDMPDPDTLFDQYIATRGIDGYSQGTFWGKFRARFPFLQGRPMRLILGELGQALEDMTVQHFVIESFDGVKPDGTFDLIGKDALKLLDDDRAQCPRASNGFLNSPINSSQTSATLSPSGIGDAEYPGGGYLNIGGTEIVNFSRIGDSLTLGRAQYGTVGVAHAAGDRVQLCKGWTAQTPATILNDLLTNYATVPSSIINLSEWQDEVATNLNELYTTLLAEPHSVKLLTSELMLQGALAMWDDFQLNLRLRVLRGLATSGDVISEENVIEGSMRIKEQPNKRLSEVWTSFALINPLKPVDEQFSYQSLEATINAPAALNHGSTRIKKVRSRWVPPGGRSIATRFNALHLSQYSNPPRRFNFSVYPDFPISLGEGRTIEWSTMQDSVGNKLPAIAIITSLTPRESQIDVEAEENLYSPFDVSDLTDRIIVIDFSQANVNVRAIHDTIFPVPTAQDVIDGVTVTCIVSAGVVLRSNSLFLPSLDIGSWPTGLPVTLRVQGRIRSHGGTGGQGTSLALKDGVKGGTAIYTRHAIDLDYTGGFIQPGGGGGGAGLYSGGGGGQGSLGGYAGQGSPGNDGRDGSNGNISAPGLGGDSVGHGFNGGGNGGFYGQSGFGGNSAPGYPAAGLGGPSGNAIDGWSFVTVTGTGSLVGLLEN